MTYKLSQEFKDFMISLKEWVDAGCPEPTEGQMKQGMGFRKNDSICFQAERWSADWVVLDQIEKDLNYLFSEQFSNKTFPFNNADVVNGYSEEYDKEIESASHYENAARVKWINDTVASFEENK